MWVIDNSGSMGNEQAAVAAAAKAMVNSSTAPTWTGASASRRPIKTARSSAGISRRTGTPSGAGRSWGRVGPATKRGLRMAPRRVERALPRGNGASKLRTQAPLITVIVSDEEDSDAKRAGCYNDRACGQAFTQGYVNFFNGQGALQAPNGFERPGSVFTVINIPAFGCGSAQNAHTYDILAIRTGGRSESICGRGGQLDSCAADAGHRTPPLGLRLPTAWMARRSPRPSRLGFSRSSRTTRWWSSIAPGPSGSTMTTRRTRSCCKATWGYRTMTDSG